MILRQNGYAMIKANREFSIREIAGIKPSLAIFDVLLPFGLGTEMCLAMKMIR
jgi:DNA-binding response OmpR family regulator